MKDLEQLENKNKQKKNTLSTPLKKKDIVPVSPSKPVNYEDKIKELEARLFGS